MKSSTLSQHHIHAIVNSLVDTNAAHSSYVTLY